MRPARGVVASAMKRKRARGIERTDGSRAPIATARSSFRLPTVAAIASALAMTCICANAGAVINTGDTGSADAGVDRDAGDDADPDDPDPDAAVDAISCPPPLGGVPPPTRVHGTGCGCGGESNDSGTAALAASAALVGIAIRRRR